MENNNRQGCRWTKASERYPTGWQLGKYNDKRIPMMFSANVIADVAGKTYSKNDVEYLDESIEPCATSSEKNIVMKKYVLGFAFNDNHVLLIEKQRPAWQKGLYNGLGGHIEGDETPVAAMVREFEEECGIPSEDSQWKEFAIMKGDDWICYCFHSRNMFDLSTAVQITDENHRIINAYTLEKYSTISNLPALIGLAMDNHIPTLTTFDYQTPSPTGDRDCEELKKEIDRLKEIHSDWLKASAETYELQHKTEISAFQNRISELESLLEIERKGRGTNEGYF